MSDTNESNEMNQEELRPSDSNQETRDSDMVNPSTLIAITIDEQEFSAKLYDNETTQAFIKKLPLNINMNDVNSNEKFYGFPDTLPTNSERPGEIHTGDIMLYGDNGLVLFYESLSSNYSYTRIGYVEEAERFAQAVGDSGVHVSFDLAEDTE